MATKVKTRLMDDVLSRVVNKRPGFARWIDRLPDDIRNELNEVREQYQSGCLQHQTRALATAVATVVAERGHPKPGIQAVLAWLKSDR